MASQASERRPQESAPLAAECLCLRLLASECIRLYFAFEYRRCRPNEPKPFAWTPPLHRHLAAGNTDPYIVSEQTKPTSNSYRRARASAACLSLADAAFEYTQTYVIGRNDLHEAYVYPIR